MPISRKGLLKTVKHMNYDKLRIRNEQILQDIGIDLRFGQTPKGFSSKNKQAFVVTENDNMLVRIKAEKSKRSRNTMPA